jgi:hypothetical protein
VSFDVFLQGFAHGQASPGRPEAALEVLTPFLAAPPRDGFAPLRTADGEAEAYGVGGTSLMVTHASGARIWDLLVSVAKAAGWVIMPVGCSVCLTTADAAGHLPEQLRPNATVVTTGQQLLAAIRNG